jgi:hypothetical protein
MKSDIPGHLDLLSEREMVASLVLKIKFSQSLNGGRNWNILPRKLRQICIVAGWSAAFVVSHPSASG